ncbi:MAG TPA: CRISPR system precrRNA processing endoribonuclease RAMP protein Cas6 [Verrucomicrobiae bacterium]|nr:CRISPR system precrRNA processing endoribonuclease RAMP protein Cas6 [Verrucomicrobiae bacterium]
MTFEFFRYRFHFRALEAVAFPPGKSANVLRGAFGTVLRESATPEEYVRLFRPGISLGKSPSGLADWPRPFIFRAAHLDGLSIAEGGPFFVDVHIFDLQRAVLPHFRSAFEQLAVHGVGHGRGRVALERIERLDLEDRAEADAGDASPPLSISLDAQGDAAHRVRIRFVTPTELKSEGKVAEQPEFPVLFGRLRDRISNLRALYGDGPYQLDYRGLSERAAGIVMKECQVEWARVKRRSGRTGQVHPLGGFTGDVAYEGELTEFLPWLRAGRWVGVGRQTVWGKGDMRVVS